MKKNVTYKKNKLILKVEAELIIGHFGGLLYKLKKKLQLYMI